MPRSAVALGGVAIAAKVAISAPSLPTHPTTVAITWLVVSSYVAIGLALFGDDLAPANGWACILAALSTVPGDLNSQPWSQRDLSAVGYLLEGLYVPAVVAVVARYPRARLSRLDRWLTVMLAVLVTVTRVPAMLTTGAMPDNFYRPAAFSAMPFSIVWHDDVGVRVGRAMAAAAILIAVVVIGWRRATTSRPGSTDRAIATLLMATVCLCGLAASVDQAVWALGEPVALQAVPAGTIRDLLAAIIPVLLLLDLLTRRARRATFVDTILRAAASGSAAALEAAVRSVLNDPSARLLTPIGRIAQPASDLPESDVSARPGPRVANSLTGRQWVDVRGHVAELPPDRPKRHTEVLANDQGTAVCAVIFDLDEVRDSSTLRSTLQAVRASADNVRLSTSLTATLSDLRTSRRRILDASIAERRKVEQDLHDGAQQQFLGVAATLARVDLAADGDVRAIVGEARGQLIDALAELRRLARGIHPTALSRGGLSAALVALASSSPVPAELDIDKSVRDAALDDGVEVTAYFVVAEAMTNTARHAEASVVMISLRLHDGQLEVDVDDDGCGGAKVSGPGGLSGLTERVRARGGWLTVDSPPGAGTRIRCRLPVREANGA